MGLALRAHGRGLKVKIIQFFKRNTGEKKVFDQLGIAYKQFVPLHPFFKDYTDLEFQDVQKEFLTFWETEVETVVKGDFDLVVLDEIGPALSWKICEEELLSKFIQTKPEKTELILTGRDIPETIKEMADYLTEMQLIRHPYIKGIQARIGIEY